MNLLQITRPDISVDTPNRSNILQHGCPNISRTSVIGRGSYGTVIKAVYKNRPVAVKIIKNSSISFHESIKRESNVIGLDHKNIINILKVILGTNHGVIIMEKCEGHCLQYILDQSAIPFCHRLLILIDIANGLNYCHNNGLLHLDVKPQNIFMEIFNAAPITDISSMNSRNYNCKLCDFGCSVMYKSIKESEATSKFIGTIRYSAPEILTGLLPSPKADIYSFGITMWQIKTNSIPFESIPCNDTVVYRVVTEHLRPDECEQNTENLPCKAALSNIHLLPDVVMRATSPDCQILSKNRSNIQKILFLSPVKCGKNCASEDRENFLPTSENVFNENAPILNQRSIYQKNTRIISYQINFNNNNNGSLFNQPFKETSNMDQKRYDTLFKNCWQHDVKDRPTMKKIVQILLNLKMKIELF